MEPELLWMTECGDGGSHSVPLLAWEISVSWHQKRSIINDYYIILYNIIELIN